MKLLDWVRDFADAHTHRPSVCCRDFGWYVSAVMAHDLYPGQCDHPGPFACTCYCRACRFMRCPTAPAVGFGGILAEQRARTRRSE